MWGSAGSVRVFFQHQGGVGAAETEAVGQNPVELLIATIGDDRRALQFGIEFLDINGGSDKVILHHQQAVDGLVDPGRPQGVAGE